MSYYKDLQIERDAIERELSSLVCYDCETTLEDCHCADRCRDCGGKCALVCEGEWWICDQCGELHAADNY